MTILRAFTPAVARIDQVQRSFLEWLANEDQRRQDAIRAYREWYDGDHDTQLTARQRRYLQIKHGQEFNDNYCSIVVDALAERLVVTGFEAEDQGTDIWSWWQANRMDRIQGQVHLAAVRDGDCYVLVDWDNDTGRPRFTMEMAYDGGEGVKLHYDPEHRSQPVFASKRWRVAQGEGTGKKRRMNLYYPNRIEKYISIGDQQDGNWQEYEDGGDEGWPLSWMAANGEPLGVPVIHFRNQDQGYNYGQSELKNVVPLQNALNKSVIDLLAVADVNGFPLPWMIGDDPSGLSLMPGSWVYSENPETRIGVLPTQDLSPLIALKDAFVMEIARVSRTPLSYFQISGQRAAEGTLKQEEAPLVSKAQSRQVVFGDAWASVMMMARRLSNAYVGGRQLDEELIVETIWHEATTRDERSHLETLKMKAELGVPVERLWIEMGYDADTIAQMRAQRGEEMTATSNIGGELLRAFESGGNA